MSNDIQQETERIHQNIVDSISFLDALANRDAEIARLRIELERAAADAIDEIERLRWLLREYADVVRLIKEGKPVPLDFLEIRIRHALGDER